MTLLLTPWFPRSTRPARYGYFERQYNDGARLHYWDGFTWRANACGAPPLKDQDVPWRGLIEDQEAVRVHKDRNSFEQWMYHHGWCDFSTYENGEYRSTSTRQSWGAWQAGQISPYRRQA